MIESCDACADERTSLEKRCCLLSSRQGHSLL
uniref:Uncharacterized protein n=1 Tax=Anguilla anguilla TaxID=7936 RepID=A0A0E9VVS7_ANGAN